MKECPCSDPIQHSRMHDTAKADDEARADDHDEKMEQTVVWEEPGGFYRLFSKWPQCWRFCPPLVVNEKASQDSSATPCVMSQSSSDDDKQPHLTTIDNVVPVIRQPPPVQIQTSWSAPRGHPTVVYVYNLPKAGRPSMVQLSDRIASIDTLTVSGDEAEETSDDEDVLPPPPPPLPIHRGPRPPLYAQVSNDMARPTMVRARTNTFGSMTTQSSRHRRLRHTVSPAEVRQVYEDDDDDTLSEASPFPELTRADSPDSGIVSRSPSKTMKRLSPPPPLVNASETSLEEEQDRWIQAWVSGAPVLVEETPEARYDIHSPEEIHVPIHSVESTYLPRCPWLEHPFLSAGGKILFAGWMAFAPDDRPVGGPPSRQDVVYVMLLEDIPKIYLARDDNERMMTLDVTPKMRVTMKDISKSHGRGIVITDDGVHIGTLLPISLPSYMFKNHSLVHEDEFQELACRTIAPFRRTHKYKGGNWHHSEYHQEYAPVAQLEAAMHLLFVMDSWMTKMLHRRR